jgi:hypothetical protein
MHSVIYEKKIVVSAEYRVTQISTIMPISVIKIGRLKWERKEEGERE